MRKVLLAGLGLLVLLLSVGKAAAEDWQAGKHYQVLPTPITTRDDAKIEVIEMFWYGCPHCYQFAPLVEAWEAKLPEDVDFYMVPGTLSKRWAVHAKAFYVAEALGVSEKMHHPLFDAVARDHKPLADEDELAAFFAQYGVAEADFHKAWKSFGVKARMDQADSKARSYRLSGVPSLVVNGKYKVDAGGAGSHENMLKVADYLIQQERKALEK
ncbi:MAG: thiol:disulfide interchange protein DsbA/DsbL [Hahellaceae bacterium]|nr:thiol:disulfide interchange protein DsbA/DsbL [Hahellaceae bacterium]MCP5170480.1 thiol:disulfide interchange protein DsbA/DsbL [Hahellaceae bacterium]